MDAEEPKPKIITDKKSGMGGARASSSGGHGGGSFKKSETNDPTLDKVLQKIRDADSVLVALSNDPSVDEIAAAMGLSMALDAADKHVTAIYSGKTPNVLEFLNPGETFETNTDSLQDFIIALNKDKADHLRYKIDGDFVKVYVTPYKAKISGDDIEFSRGDFNVDLVIALNVPAATELDEALKEHGRIMHDASSINITNGAAGKFGDVEWVDANASSISEMVAKLAFALETKMDEATATALLTGLVAATDRFSNPATTPEAMVLAAKLMGAGADQQLVVQNVQGEVVFNGGGQAKSVFVPEPGEDAKDSTKLDIAHGEEEAEEPVKDEVPEETAAGAPSPEMPSAPVPEKTDSADAVKAAMQEAMGPAAAEAEPGNNGTVAGVDVAVVPENADGYAGQTAADEILQNLEKEKSNVGSADYGKMIDEALNEPLPGEGGIQVGQNGPEGPQTNTQDVDKVEVPEGNPMAAISAEDMAGMNAMAAANPMDAQAQLGAQMMAGAGQMGAMPQQPAEQGMTEEEALNLIKQGQEAANAAIPGLPENGELPKIITGGGMGINEQNPAAAAAPVSGGMESAGGVPDMNFGASSSMPMPMPGQEMAPPPVAPMPDFGAMPPTTGMSPEPAGGAMGMPPVAAVPNTVPVPEPVPTPDVTVQPDMNAPVMNMGGGGLPQMPQVGGGSPASFGNEAVGMQTGVGNYQSGQQIADNMNAPSSDPSAFKIPGIHT